ncbi:MAG TPA: hypothetical protein VH969_13655 [Actinophytocola sp.]|uniref:hypothetical protein n=1 Tax=Actinophytocola sp. TaxID=1872138 RepID=UPI002F92A4B4
MTEQSGPRPQAADALLAVAVLGVRTGLRAGGAVARTARPVTEVVLRPEKWPSKRLRLLAEIGFRQRRAALEEAVRLYRKVTPAVITDVLAQLDLGRIAQDVIDEIDLPELIRASTGSVASESMRDVRMQAIEADETVSRWFGRARRSRPVA